MELVSGNSGPVGHDGSFDFAGQDAYIWIKNSDLLTPGSSEWLLVRAGDWVFPSASGLCCDTTIIQFSTGELASGDTPIWGGQSGVAGLGYAPNFISGASLQTYSVVPEPTSALIALLIMVGAVTRRERTVVAQA